MRIAYEICCEIRAQIFNRSKPNIDISNQGHFFTYKCSHSDLLHSDSSFDHYDRQAHKSRNTTGSLTTTMVNMDSFSCYFFWAALGFLARVTKGSSSCSAEQGDMLTCQFLLHLNISVQVESSSTYHPCTSLQFKIWALVFDNS